MKVNHVTRGSEVMKRTIGILATAILLACGVAAQAQTDAHADKASGAASTAAPTTYRLTYTIAHSDGKKQLGVQHYSLTVNPEDFQDATLSLGSRVPIATGATGNGGKPEQGFQFQYMDVGLTIRAHVREFASGVRVYSSVEQSTLADEPSGVGSSDPVIRQGKLVNTATLTLGKPMMLGSLDVPGSTMHMDIEVVLELAK